MPGRILLVLLAIAVVPAALPGQQLRTSWSAPSMAVSVPAPRPAPDSAPCFDCDPRPKRFALASAQLVAAILIPWADNRYVRDEDFTTVNAATWWTNISGDWVWDDNSFEINWFAHPYHGSLFHNAFRSNCYGFWQSSIATVAGSFLWECCAETNAIAPNDLITTALGGAGLGEVLYRISSLVLDNTATGTERTLREIGGFVVNPQRGLSRVFHGTINDVGPNGPERTPSRNGGALDLGWQSIAWSGATDTSATGGLLRLDYRYGDAIADLAGRPFSTFAFEVSVITVGASAGIEELLAHGNLAGRRIGDPDSPHHHALGVLLDYEYANNPAYEVGMQNVAGGLLSEWRLSPRATLRTGLVARGVILAGIGSPDSVAIAEGRTPEYGHGVGARLDATLQVRGAGALQAGYRLTWVNTVNGAESDHTLSGAAIRAHVEIGDRFGIGAGWKQYRISSRYANYPDDIQDASEWRFFVSTAVPHWDF